MRKHSEQLHETSRTLRSNKALFQELSDLLTRHGHSDLRVKSFGLESVDDDCGGRPKVPVKVKGPNGELITIWVCP